MCQPGPVFKTSRPSLASNAIVKRLRKGALDLRTVPDGMWPSTNKALRRIAAACGTRRARVMVNTRGVLCSPHFRRMHWEDAMGTVPSHHHMNVLRHLQVTTS